MPDGFVRVLGDPDGPQHARGHGVYTLGTDNQTQGSQDNRMTGAEIVLRALKDNGVEHIFGYPGGAVLPIYDEIFQQDDIQHILVRHEQGAGHMAEGFARASGKVGVAMATSGPGATNLVTPIADAWMDSTPIVCITGQVRSNLIGTDAFQETDATGITMPIVKHSWLVQDVRELPGVMKAAFHVARTGRPGPVLVDVAKDVQEAELDFSYPDEVDLPGWKPPTKVHERQIREAAKAIAEARQPIVYAGGGVLNADASGELLALVETGGLPAVVTLMGLLAYPAMLRHGYDPKLSAGVVCAGGCLGILIPPSVMLILYGATAGVSVVKLYAGAFLPGLMLAGLYMLYVMIRGVLNPALAPKLPPEERDVPFTFTQRVAKKLVSVLNPFFQIRSLHDFNEKFHPEWLPRVLVYRAPEDLPKVALRYAGVEGFVALPGLGELFMPKPVGEEGTAAPASAGGSSDAA